MVGSKWFQSKASVLLVKNVAQDSHAIKKTLMGKAVRSRSEDKKARSGQAWNIAFSVKTSYGGKTRGRPVSCATSSEKVEEVTLSDLSAG